MTQVTTFHRIPTIPLHPDDPYYSHLNGQLSTDNFPILVPVLAHETELIKMRGQVQRVNQLQRHNGEPINELREDTIATSVGSHKSAASMKGLETLMLT